MKTRKVATKTKNITINRTDRGTEETVNSSFRNRVKFGKFVEENVVKFQ